MKVKKVPLRKCIACGEGKQKKDLIRIVRTSDKKAVVDISGRVNGRGAYICVNNQCLKDIEKTRKLSRILEIEISDDIYDELKNAIELRSEE